MAKMTLEQLRQLREDRRQDITRREVEGKEIQVIVGMGTCGIAAGAKQTFDQIVKALEEGGLSDRVVVRQTGCMGLCYAEPTVEVVAPGMPTVIYGKITADLAGDIVKKHLLGKTLLENHIMDRPAADVIKR